MHELHMLGFVSSVVFMMTSSNGSIFRVTSPLWGEFSTKAIYLFIRFYKYLTGSNMICHDGIQQTQDQ